MIIERNCHPGLRALRHWRVLAFAVLLFAAGCDDVDRGAFGGLIGTVGYPPIAHCDVEIYDATRFENLDSQAGLIALARTNSVGKFAVEFGDTWLGRPLVVVARPGPDARYRDFGVPGTPEVVFDAPRAPWVAVLNEWLGGEDTVAVNPITTMAFHALMRLPTTEVGAGRLRFDREVVSTLHAAMGANFGLRADPAVELPAPPGGPEFAPSEANYLERNERSTSYTYACLQLAKAANEFCATSLGADSALEFFEALFRDAEDGELDGLYFGQPEPFLNQVPAVTGREASGASRLFTFLGASDLTPTEALWAGVAAEGKFDPAPAFMQELVQRATGALRPTRVDSIDVWNLPFTGGLELTVRGAGLRASDWFVLRSHETFSAAFVVDYKSVGVDGQIVYHSATEMRVLLPNLATTTRIVAPNLHVAAGADARRLRLEVLNRPEYEQLARQVSYVMTDEAQMTNRSEPLLVHARVVRVDAPGEFRPVIAADNAYTAADDPALLTPGVDRVYEIHTRICNPSPHAVNGLSLDLTATTLTQFGAPIVADSFSGSAVDRAWIVPDTLPSVTLLPGETATVAVRFVFLDTALGAQLASGVPVQVRPVIAGTSAGPGTPAVSTDDITAFTRTVAVAPVGPEQTALLASVLLTAAPAVADGATFDVEIELASTPAGAGPQRDLSMDSIDLTITFGGQSTVVRLGDAFFADRVLPGLSLTGFARQDSAGRALPLVLRQVAPAAVLRLTVRLDAGFSGPLDFAAQAQARDVATGTASTAAGGASVAVGP